MSTTPDTPFKEFLLAALGAPQVSHFPTNKQAHKARFAFYNALRTLRRSGDPWGDMKDLLEAVVELSKDGRWSLTVQRKSSHIMAVLQQAGFESGPEVPEFLKKIQKPAPAKDPAEDVRLMEELALSEWLNEYFDGDMEEIKLARQAWHQLNRPPLESFQKLVREKKPKG